MFTPNTQEVLIGLAVVSCGVAASIYKKQQPPTLDHIKGHLDRADSLYAEHLEAKSDALVAADKHIVAKKDQITGLAQAIGEAQKSIENAKAMTATEPPTPVVSKSF